MKKNAAVKGGSERVEYAVKFPGEGDGYVYLPIDSKFPADAYMNPCKTLTTHRTGSL